MKDLWRPLGVVAALLAALIFLVIRGESPDLALRRSMLTQLQLLELRDAEITRDAMLTRAGLLSSYDALQQGRVRLQEAFAELQSVSNSATPESRTAMGPHIDALARALDDKLTDIEYFKSDDALLRTSAAYLTHTISSMKLESGARRAMSAGARSLSGTFLRFVQTPNAESGAKFKAALDHLEGTGNTDVDLRGLVAHGGLVAELLPQVVSLLQRIVAAPTVPKMAQLRTRVEQVATDAEAHAQVYRYLLFGVSLVLLGYVVKQFARLRTSARELQRTNLELSREMEEREQAQAARRSLEETARQQELRLVQANKLAALGTLVSGVAHEINNPNQLVLLNSSVLGDVWRDAVTALDMQRQQEGDFTLAGLPYGEMREAASTLIRDVNEGARRIDRIVQDLKDFARPQRSGSHAEIQVNEVVHSAVRLLTHLIHKRCHRFRLALADNLPPIRGDAQQVEQVLVNLLMNALEALPDPDRGVTVESRRNPADGCVLIAVRDEGIGIAPADLERLCDPFFTTKQDSGGTGLGLSVTFSIVQAHGGRLDFASEPERGTSATVSFPPLPQHDESTVPPPKP
jgi:signal transduction histidine kinase